MVPSPTVEGASPPLYQQFRDAALTALLTQLALPAIQTVSLTVAAVYFNSEDAMPKAVALSDYTRKVRATQVFKLDATPKSSPIDINLPALIQESGWNLSDRLRCWHTLAGMVPHTGLTIRKLDLDERALVHCNVDTDGALSILSNNREYATRFFRTVFLNSPPKFAGSRDLEGQKRLDCGRSYGGLLRRPGCGITRLGTESAARN